MTNKIKISFVIPTKNEQQTIAFIINSIREISEKENYQIVDIIISDDSRDNTRKIAHDLGARVLIAGAKGLGHAMLKGLKTAVQKDIDVVISLDSDGQVDLNEIPSFVSEAIHKNFDMVLASRFLKKGLVDYKYPLINRFGTIVLSKILRKFTDLPLTDSHGGIRAIKPEVIRELELVGSHTYVQETIIDAVEKGFRLTELPSRWKKRNHGKSRVVKSIPKYVFYTLPVLIIRAGNHIRYLFSFGIFLIFMAFVHIGIVLYQTEFSLEEIFERRSLVLFLVLISLGVNLFLFGVILEMMTNMIKRKSYESLSQ